MFLNLVYKLRFYITAIAPAALQFAKPTPTWKTPRQIKFSVYELSQKNLKILRSPPPSILFSATIAIADANS
jgi:hypothetical protein